MTQKTRTNILAVASSFPCWPGSIGGLFVYDLSRRLANSFNIAVLTPQLSCREARAQEIRSGLFIYRFRYFWPTKWQKLCGPPGGMPSNLRRNKLLFAQIPFFALALLLNIRKIVERKNIDVIHAHWILPIGLICVLYKKIFRKKIKIVGTIYGDIFGLPILNPLRRWVMNNMDHLVAISSDMKDRVADLNIKTKVDLIHMGVDDQLFRPNRYDENIRTYYNIKGPFLLFVGRLVERKGVHLLLSAMPEVVKKYPDTKLLIVSTGPMEDELKRQAKELGLANNVVFTGIVPMEELPKYYATADIFIGPSITTKSGESEGFGLVFVEAMLSKTAVISSDLAAISDSVRHGVTGIQCDVRDTRSFAQEIISLIQDEKKRHRLVEDGYRHAKDNFTWDIVVRKYCENIFTP